MSNYVLIQWDKCYADEFDVVGGILLSDKKFKEYKKYTEESLDYMFYVLTEEEYNDRKKIFEENNRSTHVKYYELIENYHLGNYSIYDHRRGYQNTYQKYLQYRKNNGIELYFGTNEAVQFNSKKEYWDSLAITKISSEEAEVLKKYITTSYGNYGTGNFFPLEY